MPSADLREACVHNGAYFAHIYANGIYRSTDDGQSWSGKPKTPEGQPLVPRVDPPYSHIKAFRYVRGLRYKLYSDGRFYDLKSDLHERRPIPSGAGSPDAERARAALQQALAQFPEKKR